MFYHVVFPGIKLRIGCIRFGMLACLAVFVKVVFFLSCLTKQAYASFVFLCNDRITSMASESQSLQAGRSSVGDKYIAYWIETLGADGQLIHQI